MNAPRRQNRTGIAVSPDAAAEMIAATGEFPPSSPGGSDEIAAERMEYTRQGEPVGSMPPMPGRRNGRLGVLLDKLGERLAFERAGTRLYDALVSKHDAGGTFRGAPARDELLEIRNEEHGHFLMVGEAIARLGGDPTVVTPSADVQMTASKGLPAVLADPRTDLLESLEAILTAELVDNDCWPALIELAQQAGEIDLATQFTSALEAERRHLENVRTWVAIGAERSVERALRAGAETRRTPAEPRRTQAEPRPRTTSKTPARASSRRRTAAKGPARKATGGQRGRARGRRSKRSHV
jgi:rubrerythrin